MPDLFLSLKLVHLLAAILMVGATVINGLIHNMARKASPARAEAMLSIVLAVNSYIMGPVFAGSAADGRRADVAGWIRF